MLDGVLGRSDSDDSEDDENREMEKETVKGILSENENSEDIFEALKDDDMNSFVVNATVNQLEKLSELDCYDDSSYAYKDALKFAKRWSSSVECYLTVIDTYDKFEVRISSVIATNITNSMVRDFAKDFRTNIHSTFDPLAEEHDEPYLSIEPF